MFLGIYLGSSSKIWSPVVLQTTWSRRKHVVTCFHCCLWFIFSLEKHFLRYEFTVLTKTDSFPAFSAVCESDDKLIAHYSNEEGVWIRENLTDWTEAPAEPPESRDWYLDQLSHLSNCTLSDSAQCSGECLIGSMYNI